MYHVAARVALAEVRQRSRSRGLLVVPVVVAFFGYMITADEVALVVGQDHSGTLTAAYVGHLMAVSGTPLLALLGFPLVSGAIERDRQSGIDQLIATSKVSNTAYLLGKWLGNLVLLAGITAIVAVAAVGTFLARGTGSISIADVLLPFVLLTVPVMAVVAALAVLFDTVDFFRNTAGTVVYLLGTLTLLVAVLANCSAWDPFGITIARRSMEVAAGQGTVIQFGFVPRSEVTESFTWHGIDWTPRLLVGRLLVVATAVGMLVLSIASFDRFSTNRQSAPSASSTAPSPETTPGDEREAAAVGSVGDITPVDRPGRWTRLATLSAAELTMTLRVASKRLYVAGGALILVGFAVPPSLASALVLPVVWLLPIGLWSSLGVREHRHGTESIVFTTTSPIAQLWASWLAGVAVALLAATGVLARFLLVGDGTAFAVGLGALLVPALAVACGIWFRDERGFEAVYLLAWYLGPINGIDVLDFTNIAPTIKDGLTPGAFLMATGLMLAMATIGRYRWLRRR